LPGTREDADLHAGWLKRSLCAIKLTATKDVAPVENVGREAASARAALQNACRRAQARQS